MEILLATDRSAGHIFPALTLAKKIKENNKIYFFATSKSLNEYLNKDEFIVLGKSFNFRNLLIEGVFRFFEAIYIILFKRPKKIIGFGGRDSFFLVLLGSIFCIDTFIYEPNVKMGRANKILSYFVKKIFLGFPNDSIKKAITVGIPLRENIKRIPKSEVKKELDFDDHPVIFFFGGSQGSMFINNLAMRFVNDVDYRCNVIHIAGKKEYFKIKGFYNKINKKVFLKDFFYNMEILYSASDLVISRSGANTLAEIFYYNLPAILIPHPLGFGHQKENAFYFYKKRAGIVFFQDNFSFDEFKKVVKKILFDKEFQENLRKNLKGLNLTVDIKNFYNNIYYKFLC